MRRKHPSMEIPPRPMYHRFTRPEASTSTTNGESQQNRPIPAKLCEKLLPDLKGEYDWRQAGWELSHCYDFDRWGDEILENLILFPAEQTDEERRREVHRLESIFLMRRRENSYIIQAQEQWVMTFRDILEKHISIESKISLLRLFEHEAIDYNATSPNHLLFTRAIAFYDSILHDPLSCMITTENPETINLPESKKQPKPEEEESCPYDLSVFNTEKQKKRFLYVFRNRPTIQDICQNLKTNSNTWNRFVNDSLNNALSRRQQCSVVHNKQDDRWEVAPTKPTEEKNIPKSACGSNTLS